MPKGWRFKTGILCIILNLALAPIITPFITMFNMPTGTKAAIMGFLWIVLPPMFSVIGVFLLGKPGFNYLVSLIFRRFKSIVLVDTPGPFRHVIGLVMFLCPLLLAAVTPYFNLLFPGWLSKPLLAGVIGDVSLILSLFILGGNFWDKLKGLFIRKAIADIPTIRV